MTQDEFEHLLVAHGADVSLWPEPARRRARDLMARDPSVAGLLAAHAALDVRVARAVAAGPAAQDLAAGRRIAARLAALPLPPQGTRAPVRWLPSWLLALDLRPAWPSIAALAGMAALGFLAGLNVVDPSPLDATMPALTHPQMTADLSTIVFEPGPPEESAL
ncbi:hypothetical protein [Roseixanthobacter glucoisosaccharinicivorans]|uniref:hypothetical protein n=1 Tax=Roseixanthobacter glucoisosaccharinicivorans TaxID=3119923 RepID=UPI003728E615